MISNLIVFGYKMLLIKHKKVFYINIKTIFHYKIII